MALQVAANGSLLRISGTPDNLAAHVNCCCPDACACDPHSGAPFSSIEVEFSGILCCTAAPGACDGGCPECLWTNATFDLSTPISDCIYEWSDDTVWSDCGGPAGGGGCSEATKRILALIGSFGAGRIDMMQTVGVDPVWKNDTDGQFCYPGDILVGWDNLLICNDPDTRNNGVGWGGQMELISVTP